MTSYETTTGAGGRTEADAVADLAARVAVPVVVQPGEVTRTVVPGGSQVQEFDGESLLDGPRRKRGNVTLFETGSFVAYASKHWVSGSACFVDYQGPKVVAVLNGHDASAAGWGDHRVTFAPRLHRDWKAWAQIEAAGWITQGTLAEFVAVHLATIEEPDGASVLELAQQFEATVSAKFQSGARLASGARQVVFTEDVAAKSGELEIPESLTVAVPVMEGDDPVSMRVWLRFRIREGGLGFRLLRDRADDLLEASLDAKVDTIGEALDPVYYGLPA